MNYKFRHLLGAPYRGGNTVITSNEQLISPIGNRISITDLHSSNTITLPSQCRSNISRIAVSPDSLFLLAIDESSRSLFINLHTHTVLHHITFKFSVHAVKFSPNGTLIAVATGNLIQIWRSPGFSTQPFPFELLRTFSDFGSAVTCLDWSPDSDYLLAGSKDHTARLFKVKKTKHGERTIRSGRSFMFLGHRDSLMGTFFGIDKRIKAVDRVYTVTRDSYLLSWGFTEDGDEEPTSPGTPEQRTNGRDDTLAVDVIDGGENRRFLNKKKWVLLRKDGFTQTPARVTACDYHRELDFVVVGFSNGVFALYQMPEFVCIHSVSISREKITSAVFNVAGNWLGFGCAKLGQLLVWEWRSESYVLKHQGHYFDVNCLAFSPDSQLLATGADDNKIKIWTMASGNCFVTFSEHVSAVTALHFVSSNSSLISASLDGTVRAWDLVRYRNFRTFTSPSSRQFVSLTSDQSGEVICAGTLDLFEIFVWSMKTGRLLDILSGHEGPVHGLMFSPINSVLASSSWDKTVRLWEVFEGKGTVETFRHSHDVLSVSYRPDGRQVACSTLDGQIYFWDPLDGVLMYTIEGQRDIAGGRLMTDRRSAANSTSGKYFTTLSYSADGNYILAGGNSRYICVYDVAEQVLLRRFQTTLNISLDGVLDFLDSKKMTNMGPLDLIDDYESDTEEGVDRQLQPGSGLDLPGAKPNQGRPIIKTKCLRIAPTGRTWAAATTEGVLVYSVDESFIFDPTDLDLDVTPEAVEVAVREGNPSKALILGLRMNEDSIIKKCVLSVNPEDVAAVSSSVPFRYLHRLMDAIASLLENSPHLELLLRWSQEICRSHGEGIHQNWRTLLPSLKSLQKAVTVLHDDLSQTCSSNLYTLRYLFSAPSNRTP